MAENQQHKCSNLEWCLSINEDGWSCIECDKLIKGEPKGYSPKYDESLIEIKVEDILHQLNDATFLYISNGSSGNVIESMVVSRCRNENRFDQYSIIRFIYDLEAPGHADYWRNLGMQIRSGNDPRDRCDSCKALATSWRGDKKWCSEHWKVGA